MSMRSSFPVPVYHWCHESKFYRLLHVISACMIREIPHVISLTFLFRRTTTTRRKISIKWFNWIEIYISVLACNLHVKSSYVVLLTCLVLWTNRAEEYFKRATEVEPPDAEAYSKYATFLWKVKNDLWAAEETYLEAISAEPSNSYYAANYAHFLWNTGGEDTCFPLSSPDNTSHEV